MQQRLLVGGQRGIRELVPTADAAPRVATRHELLDRSRTGVDVAVDLEVVASPVGVGELRGKGRDQRRRQRIQVGSARGFVLVEQGVTARFGIGAVLVDHGAEKAVAVTEVVLQSARVALPGFAIDLTERHGVDSPRREQALGRMDDLVAGIDLRRGLGHPGSSFGGSIAGMRSAC